MDYNYVYAIECEGFIKVGLARSPSGRLGELQVASPFSLKLLSYKEFGTRRSAKDTETLLHQALADQNVRGEWFHAHPIDPVYALKEYHDAYLKMVEMFGECYWESEAIFEEAARLGIAA